MTTTWTNVLNGAATTVGATPGDAVPATTLAEVLQISNQGAGVDSTLRSVTDGGGDAVPLQVSTSAVMLPNAVIWPYGDSTFFSAGQTGILIPYYLYPNNPYSDATVTRLLGLIRQYRGRVPVIVVINPGSGPGTVTDGNYTAFIKLIQAAGGKVAGYVSTAYAVRAEAAVKADVDTWLALYAAAPIDTIFFDEQTYDLGSGNANVALYKRYTDYSHARNLAPVICNPGTNQREEYFATRTGDIIVVAETGTWPTVSDMLGAFIGGHIDYKTSLRAALVYGQTALIPGKVRQLARYVQWIYATGDALSPNPWDSLSAHLEQLFALLAGPETTVNVRSFGAVGDGTTDDTATINLALAYATANPGSAIHFPAGDYVSSGGHVLPDRCRLYGDGIGITRILWDETDNLFVRTSGSSFSDLTLDHFTIKGTFVDVTNEGLGTKLPVFCYITTNIRVDHVRIEKCRYFGLTFRNCSKVVVTNCEISEVYRDGITCATCSSVTISNNIVDHCDDDAIVVSTADGTAKAQVSATITGNRISDSQGICVLGGRRITITGNQIERCRLRGINVGYEGTEGNTSRIAVTISGNTITDIINRNTIDALSNAADYITVKGIRNLGGLSVLPGDNITGTGAIQDIHAYIDNNGTSTPQIGGYWIAVTGNTCARTLPTGGAYSALGYGSMFTRNGYVDPTLTAAMLTAGRGIVIESLREAVIASNVVSGVAKGVSLRSDSSSRFRDLLIVNNVFSRFSTAGIYAETSLSADQDIVIRGNVFDGDPSITHANRGTTGTWLVQNTGPIGVVIGSGRGIDISSNTFRNLSIATDQFPGTAQMGVGNVFCCQPVALNFSTSNKGIGTIFRSGPFVRYVVQDCDPTSATYGTTLNECLVQASAIPTTGIYVIGHFVRNVAPTISANRVVLGWLRLTTGSGHVDATDWATCYAATV